MRLSPGLASTGGPLGLKYLDAAALHSGLLHARTVHVYRLKGGTIAEWAEQSNQQPERQKHDVLLAPARRGCGHRKHLCANLHNAFYG